MVLKEQFQWQEQDQALPLWKVMSDKAAAFYGKFLFKT